MSQTLRSRSKARAKYSARLDFDRLEAKQMLAANAFLTGTVLTLAGTQEAETFSVSIDNKKTVSTADDLVVVNYFDNGNSFKKTFPLASVTQINAFLGAGDDHLDNSGTNLPSMVFGGTGNDVVYGGGGSDTVYGGPDNDLLIGNGGSDYLDGQDGNDELQGGDGNDTLVGETGSDMLFGMGGNDLILGGDGNDWMMGGDGNDILNGGLGVDTFHGGTGADTLVAYDGGLDYVYGDGGGDSYWLDGPLVDLVHDFVPSDFLDNQVHQINTFVPYTVNGIGSIPVPTALNGPNLFDPFADTAGYTKFNFANAPLFASGGPTIKDINQGAIGDCYFMAGLAAVARTDPDRIRQLVTALGDGTYAVDFHKNGQDNYVRVDADLYTKADGSLAYSGFGVEGSIWVPIVEKAWAVYRNNQGAYSSTEGGNNPGADWSDALGFSHTEFATTSFPTSTLFLSAIKAQLDAGKALTIGGPAALASGINLNDPNNFHRGQHIFAVESVNLKNGLPSSITLYNPYGAEVTVSAAEAFFCCGGFRSVKVFP